MSIIGNISGVPVFNKKEEALVWGKRKGLTGYHTHTISGKTGYMGGSDHEKAVKTVPGAPTITATPKPVTTPLPVTPSPPVAPSPPTTPSPPPPLPTDGGGY